MPENVKTAAEVANDLREAYALIKPLHDALSSRLDSFVNTIKKFHREHSWYNDEKYGWVETENYFHAELGNLADEGMYLFWTSYSGTMEEEYITYEEMDDVDSILERNFAEYVSKKADSDAEFKNYRRKKLEAELAALDD